MTGRSPAPTTEPARELVDMRLPYVTFHAMRLWGQIVQEGDHFRFSDDFEAFLNEWLRDEIARAEAGT